MGNPKFKETLQYLLQSSGAIGYFRYDASFVPVALDVPASVSVNITDADIFLDGGDPAWSYTKSAVENIITGIRVNYQYSHPKQSYEKQAFVYHSSYTQSSITNMVDSEAELYEGYLEDAYTLLGQEKIITIDCPSIRDTATAENLIKQIVQLRYKQYYILSIDCRCTVIGYEMGDNVGVTATVIPEYLQDKFWKVIGHRIQPPINGIMPSIKLSLLELSPLPPPDTIDEGDGAIDNTGWQVYDEGDGAIDNSAFSTINKL